MEKVGRGAAPPLPREESSKPKYLLTCSRGSDGSNVVLVNFKPDNKKNVKI